LLHGDLLKTDLAVLHRFVGNGTAMDEQSSVGVVHFFCFLQIVGMVFAFLFVIPKNIH
jgi:hypothetical protein